MKNKTLFGILAFAFIALLGIGIVAAQGKFGFLNSLTVEDKEILQIQHQAIQDAIENKDFASWKSLHEQRIAFMQSQLTEENFNKIVERHSQMNEFRIQMQNARETGDYSLVQELKESYGFSGNKNMMHSGMFGFGNSQNYLN